MTHDVVITYTMNVVAANCLPCRMSSASKTRITYDEQLWYAVITNVMC